jgi:hypothetical protein
MDEKEQRIERTIVTLTNEAVELGKATERTDGEGVLKYTSAVRIAQLSLRSFIADAIGES